MHTWCTLSSLLQYQSVEGSFQSAIVKIATIFTYITNLRKHVDTQKLWQSNAVLGWRTYWMAGCSGGPPPLSLLPSSALSISLYVPNNAHTAYYRRVHAHNTHTHTHAHTHGLPVSDLDSRRGVSHVRASCLKFGASQTHFLSSNTFIRWWVGKQRRLKFLQWSMQFWQDATAAGARSRGARNFDKKEEEGFLVQLGV